MCCEALLVKHGWDCGSEGMGVRGSSWKKREMCLLRLLSRPMLALARSVERTVAWREWPGGRIIWVKYYGRWQHRNGRRFARLARKAVEGVGTLGTCSGIVGTLDQHDECESCLGLRGTNMGLRTGPLTEPACTFTGFAG